MLTEDFFDVLIIELVSIKYLMLIIALMLIYDKLLTRFKIIKMVGVLIS
jgi:hypothetical protein